jgi:hypothetical protein
MEEQSEQRLEQRIERNSAKVTLQSQKGYHGKKTNS